MFFATQSITKWRVILLGALAGRGVPDRRGSHSQRSLKKVLAEIIVSGQQAPKLGDMSQTIEQIVARIIGAPRRIQNFDRGTPRCLNRQIAIVIFRAILANCGSVNRSSLRGFDNRCSSLLVAPPRHLGHSGARPHIRGVISIDM
jgi:hypothetical protein